MGFFGKLKESMTGDVKVQADVPAVVHMDAPSFDVVATLTNEGTDQQTIRQVSVNVMREK